MVVARIFGTKKTLMCYISILFSICFIIGKKIDWLEKNLLIFMLFTPITVSMLMCLCVLLAHKIQILINKKGM